MNANAARPLCAEVRSARPSTQQQQRVNAHFQAHAAEWKRVYEHATVEGAIYRERLALVLKWVDELALPRGERVLEIGCGAGLCTIALAERGYIVCAIDSVAQMLQSTRRLAADAGASGAVFATAADAHDLAFSEGSFGLVLATGVLPYLHDAPAALKEMARVLRPGGVLVVTAGNRWRLNDALDPWLCPALARPRAVLRGVLQRVGRRRAVPAPPVLELVSFRTLRAWVSSAALTTRKAATVGFQPWTLHRRPVFREAVSLRLHGLLQWLADRRVPGIRWSGMDFVVLARKEPAVAADRVCG